MGKRGPKSGTPYKERPGPKVSMTERARRTKRSLAAMYPGSLRLISRSLNYEMDKPEGQPVDTEDAWKVTHMLDGMPRQRQEVTGADGGPLQVTFTLNIGPRPPLRQAQDAAKEPDSTQEDKSSIQERGECGKD